VLCGQVGSAPIRISTKMTMRIVPRLIFSTDVEGM
jgi:hypothetical protein